MTDGHDPQDAAEGDHDPARDADGSEIAIPPQTPLFRAFHMARYRRQEAIKEIQKNTGRRLICYVADSGASLSREDVMPLMDLLHLVPIGTSIDFLLQTGGGDVDAADKIAGILRKRVGSEGTLRVVVPDFAKSAGTLIALGADLIVMSDSSELGPIDPQIVSREGQRPARTYVDSYDALASIINNPASYADGKRTDAERQMLEKFDPAFLDLCRQALERSRKLAEKLLSQGMLRESANWTEVAFRLTDNTEWLSQHGAHISCDDAGSLGLRIDYKPPNDPLWQAYWRLFCEQRLALSPDCRKLFESDYASIPFS